MPKTESLRKIDAAAPVGAVVVGGGFMPSAVGRSIVALADAAGNLAQPDGAGRVLLRAGDGIDVSMSGAEAYLAVDASVPRTAFTGRMIIGTGAPLAFDLPASGNQLFLTENILNVGQSALLQARGVWEYVFVTAAGVNDAGAWRYGVTRNYISPGPYNWRAGDVVMRLGATGEKTLEISGAQGSDGVAGPSVVIKQITGDPDMWTPLALFGNLRGRYGLPDADVWGIGAGLYDYGWFTATPKHGVRVGVGANLLGLFGPLNGNYDYATAETGLALGEFAGGWIGIEPTNGIRMMRGRTRMAQWREREIVLGEDGQPQLRLSPTAIDFLGPNGSVQASLDGETRTIFGFERWGRPLGPALEIGPTDDGRWGHWARGENNVPFFALLSGTDALPDDVFFRLGAQGATDYLEMADGRIRTSCELIAPRGVIGGWTIERDRLTGTGMIKLAGDTAAKRVIIDAGQASYPISAGNDLPASAPFRVGWFGDVWCNSIKSLQGSTNTNVIDVTGNDSSSGAIIGRGGKYGVYGLSGGYGQGAGVYGWTSSGTGSAGVRGFASGGFVGVYGDAQSGTGVYGDGDIGVIADGNTISLKLVGAPMDANAQDIKSVNRLDFGGTQYLYRSGADLYWYNGSTGVKLN